MRQFVFGILAAAGLWWGYQQWQGDADEVGAAGGGNGLLLTSGNPPGSGAANVGDLLDADQPGGGNPAAAPVPAAAPAASVDALVGALVTAAEPAHVDAAWAALAGSLVAGDRQRLLKVLTPRDAQFASRLAALGSTNAFLHSAEGRAAAQATLAALEGQPDEVRCQGGSQLVSLATRGRLENGDTAAMECLVALYREHRNVVERWLCDPANLTRARSHTIEAGKGLGAVATKFRREGLLVEAGTLAVLNRIHNQNLVRAGQQIKVPVDPIVAVLEKRSYMLAVYVGEHLLRLYRVGHGAGDKTPVTEFTVTTKQPKPHWTAPNGRVYPYGHPENILGEYFIKFQHASYTGFGAHGTPQPGTIGTMSSAGCIRMLDADIDELFKILPSGAKVVVRANDWQAAAAPR